MADLNTNEYRQQAAAELRRAISVQMPGGHYLLGATLTVPMELVNRIERLLRWERADGEQPKVKMTVFQALTLWRKAWRQIHGVPQSDLPRRKPQVRQFGVERKLAPSWRLDEGKVWATPEQALLAMHFCEYFGHVKGYLRQDDGTSWEWPSRIVEKWAELAGANLTQPKSGFEETEARILAWTENQRAAQGGVTGAMLGAQPAGLKIDDGKLEMWEFFSVFRRAIAAVAKHAQWGVSVGNRGWGNQRIVPDGVRRYRNGLMRHVMGENFAPGSLDEHGKRHLVAAAWNILELIEREEADKEGQL